MIYFESFNNIQNVSKTYAFHRNNIQNVYKTYAFHRNIRTINITR